MRKRKMYLSVEDIAELFGLSVSFAYRGGGGKNECRSGKQELLCYSRTGANPLCRGQDLWSGTC